jgi:hypothetical protein
MCTCKWACKVNPSTGRHIKIGGPTDLKKSIKPIQSGILFEKAVSNRFKDFGHSTEEKTAGSTSDVDVQVVMDKTNQKLSIECKTKNAFEGGQISVGVKNDVYVFPMTEKAMLFKRLLGDHLPFSGKIPSFKKGDKSVAQWEKEKHNFKGYYLSCDENAIADYYRQKGVHYIQIENKGLYHTGEDVNGFCVPMFTVKTKVRIRCKQHGSSPMPGSVMISLNFDRSSLPQTKFCLMNCDLK